MKSGIYKILNTHNRMIYVGSAVDFQQRFYLHIYHLNANTHFNKHLQNAWNKYGENAFEFKILEFCEKDNLIKREQHWIDWTLCYQREIGYNSRRKAETNLGLQWSEETKRKMGQKNIGRKHTQEHKDKVIKALTGRFFYN
jgi:group I intron endonuclease